MLLAGGVTTVLGLLERFLTASVPFDNSTTSPR